jgi:hypothetical protein
MILEMLLMLQPHSTDFALEPIPFFDVGQMLPFKVKHNTGCNFVSLF